MSSLRDLVGLPLQRVLQFHRADGLGDVIVHSRSKTFSRSPISALPVMAMITGRLCG